jgi:mannosyltransferase OCH1-like enzyme
LIIPKTFHQIWLGTEPRHPKFVEWWKAWKYLHPDWEMKLWVQDGVDAVTCGPERVVSRHLDALTKAYRIAEQANIWSYDLLEQFGGVYVETDMEPVKSIEPLIAGEAAFAGRMAVFRDGKPIVTVGCGIIGTVSRHSWLEDLVGRLPTGEPSRPGTFGSRYLDAVTRDHPEVALFEPDVFYPKVPFGPVNAGAVHSETYAVHHASGRWWPASYNALI